METWYWRSSRASTDECRPGFSHGRAAVVLELRSRCNGPSPGVDCPPPVKRLWANTLDEEVPVRKSEALFGAVASAMREYNKRLSTHAVSQIIEDPPKEQVTRFIDLVHAADPSSLVTVFDEQVVDFLHQFIRVG